MTTDENGTRQLSMAVDDLLDQLQHKFDKVSTEIFGKSTWRLGWSSMVCRIADGFAQWTRCLDAWIRWNPRFYPAQRRTRRDTATTTSLSIALMAPYIVYPSAFDYPSFFWLHLLIVFV